MPEIMSTPNTTLAQDSTTSPTILHQVDVDEGNDKVVDNELNTQTEKGVEDDAIGTDVEEDTPFTTKKRKRTSKVWQDFKEVIMQDGTITAECIHCKKKLKMNSTGSTTHLGRHLKSCPRKHINLKGQQQISMATTIAATETVTSVQNFVFSQAKIREVLSHMIIVHELPFRFVEYDLFNLLMKSATPLYQKISRATSKKDCMVSYEIEKKKLMEELKCVSKVSVTTDLWKSDQKISYMVVTCHYVDSNWNLQKRTLNFCDVPPPHTGHMICDVLQKCLTEWEIEQKVWTVTVDNATINDLGIRLLKENLSYGRNLPLGGQIFHVRCCAHILNILVQFGLTAIQETISKVRESVKHIIASEARLNMFTEIAKQMKLPSKKLVLDVCTRWNATYFMLSAALEFKDVFPKYQQRDSTYKQLPSEGEWKNVQVVCSFLEEFHDVTELISGSEYPTSNLFLTELIHIKQILMKDRVGDDTCLIDMVTNMRLKFDKYWGDCNLLICIAAVLDPRNKMKLIEWCAVNICSEADGVVLITTVRESLRNLYSEYVLDQRTNIVGNTSDAQSDSHSSSCVTTYSGRKSRRQFDSFIQNVDSVAQMQSELDLYLEEGVVIHNGSNEFDVISWWRANDLKFRILSRMACDVISIPITSVASESAFSAGGRVIDPHRASLGVDTVQMLLCAGDWLRARYGIKGKAKDKTSMKEINFN